MLTKLQIHPPDFFDTEEWWAEKGWAVVSAQTDNQIAWAIRDLIGHQLVDEVDLHTFRIPAQITAAILEPS